MWIFTETGFVSAVRHFSEPDQLVVRARDQISLENLADLCGAEIKRTPVNDYPYRVQIADKKFAVWMTNQISSTTYTNFKSRVHETRGHHFADTLMNVWSAMHDVEDSGARR